MGKETVVISRKRPLRKKNMRKEAIGLFGVCNARASHWPLLPQLSYVNSRNSNANYTVENGRGIKCNTRSAKSGI